GVGFNRDELEPNQVPVTRRRTAERGHMPDLTLNDAFVRRQQDMNAKHLVWFEWLRCFNEHATSSDVPDRYRFQCLNAAPDFTGNVKANCGATIP
ncbi:MAG TPA: hypothetical protein VLU24_11515, partial [Mycobacterium sp.]|nr:hypothetical protein [Mycobacterium sp.]